MANRNAQNRPNATSVLYNIWRFSASDAECLYYVIVYQTPPNSFFVGFGVARRCAPCAVFRGAEPKYNWFYIIRFASVISAYNQFNALKMPYTIYMAFSTWRLITLLCYILLSLLFVFCFIAFNRAFNRFTPFLALSLYYGFFYVNIAWLFIFALFSIIMHFCIIMLLLLFWLYCSNFGTFRARFVHCATCPARLSAWWWRFSAFSDRLRFVRLICT